MPFDPETPEPFDDARLTFVVGTGRCGSTLLARLLRQHPDILLLSPFFLAIQRPRFPEGTVDGERFWTLLSTPRARHTYYLRSGLSFPELPYPVGPTTRFNARTGVPPLVMEPLSFLLGPAAAEALHDELARVIPRFGPAPIEVQYGRLFGLLLRRLGRKVCVERSPINTLLMVPKLARAFPRARFVHLVRDGRDCALSMSKSPFFRLDTILHRQAAALGVDPLASPDRSRLDALEPDLRPLLPERFDPAAYERYAIAPEVFGRQWSRMMSAGTRALAELGDDRVLTVTYEDLVQRPAPTLEGLVRFVHPELPASPWVESVVPEVRDEGSRWLRLPPAGQAALVDACAPGMRVLQHLRERGFGAPPPVGAEDLAELRDIADADP